MKRGFVMVVLLAIVAAMTIVLSGVLISNQYSSKIALREADDLKARNVAELCLSKGVAVAVAHFRARGGDEFDFDGLLDPDEVSGNSDDYVFANVTTANTRVIVPASAAGTATEPLFRYAFERIDPDGAGPDAPGGCYLRFDDNADDNLPGYAAQTGNTGGVAEGTGVNVNNRDRDASIVVTAIGIYPAFTTTADADAYGKAHARVTMKQYFSASPAPAIYGNGDINVSGNTEFCGTGGLRGVDVNVTASSCVCGDTLARSVNGSASTSTVDECGVSRCPRVAGQNDVNSLPNTAPFTTDFTEQCLIYSETLGENPSAFRITDPVAPAGRAPTFDANNLRVHLREDGAVFVWDGRSNSNALATTVSNTPCDGFPPVWPPANSTNTPANNTAKDAICSPLVDGGQGGFYCPITGDPFDKEFCRRDAIHTPGNPTAVPPVAPVNLPPVTSTTRCDRLNVSGTPADQSPIEGNNAAKNALCTTAALGQPAVCTSSGNPLDRELCTPPGTFVSCSTSDANELPLSPAQWASFTSTDITTLEATHCFSNGRKTDGSVCTPLPGALQPQKLCWRMVADLDGTAETDSRGTAEWEAPAGARALQIPAGAAVVPNLRGDGRLTPTNLPLTAVPTATVLNIGAQETTTVAQPTLRWLGNRWATESGWLNSNVSRRMPRPTQIRVAQTAQEPVLTLSADTRVGGVRWLVRGGVEAPSGTVTLAHRFGQAHANYAGGSTGCTMENAPFNAGEVNTAMGQDVLVATGRISVAANAFTAVGRLVGEGGLLVQTPADRTCLVGGLSFGGFSGGCGSATACDQPGVCFENRVAVIGSVLAEQDLAAPRGIFAQRGNGPLKISQLMSRRNVCINGSSRVVGQIVSERLGGTIDVGPDLLMLQSGEVGVGFATRKTTWNDTSW